MSFGCILFVLVVLHLISFLKFGYLYKLVFWCVWYLIINFYLPLGWKGFKNPGTFHRAASWEKEIGSLPREATDGLEIYWGTYSEAILESWCNNKEYERTWGWRARQFILWLEWVSFLISLGLVTVLVSFKADLSKAGYTLTSSSLVIMFLPSWHVMFQFQINFLDRSWGKPQLLTIQARCGLISFRWNS